MPDDPKPPAYEPPDDNRPASAAPTEPELEAECIRRPRHDPYAALRHRPYRLFSLGWMAAVVGSQMTAAALTWELAQRTGNALALGWLAGVQVIPLVCLALPAGVIADRFDRRRLIQVTAFLNALCSVGLALLSYRPGGLPWMYACVIASATALTLGRPARSALLPNIVPAAAFTNAITWNSSMFQVSAMCGAAAGGLLIDFSEHVFHSLALPYLLDAAGAAFYAALIFAIPKPAMPPQSATRNSQSAIAQLSAGIHFVWQTKIILATLTLDLFAVLLGGAVYILPIFAQQILHVGGFRFGLLRAADAIGAVTMSVIVAHMPPMRRAGRAMLLAVAAFGACTIVFGLSRSYVLSLVMLVLIGAVDNISVVVRHTLVQVLTPDEMRGRVSAVNNVFIGASNELGGFESGLTAAWLGPVKSVVCGGIGTLLTVALTAWKFPQLRTYGPLQPHTPPQKTLSGRAGAVEPKPA